MGLKEFWKNRKKRKESRTEMSAAGAENAAQNAESNGKSTPAKEAAGQEEGFRFDREHHKPIIRSSICTGEQVAGFKDKRTGRFTEIMLVRDNEDMEEFTKRFGISREEITREW